MIERPPCLLSREGEREFFLLPANKGKTFEVPGSVSGDVELEQLLVSLSLAPLSSFSKLVVRHAMAWMPSPLERPGGILLAFSRPNRPSLPSPLRIPRADFALKDAIMLQRYLQAPTPSCQPSPCLVASFQTRYT